MSPAHTRRRILAGLSIGLLVLCAVVFATGSSERAGADVPDVALTSLGTFASPLYVTSPPGDPGADLRRRARGDGARRQERRRPPHAVHRRLRRDRRRRRARTALDRLRARLRRVGPRVRVRDAAERHARRVGVPRGARRRRGQRGPPHRAQHPPLRHQPQRRPAPVRARRLPLHRRRRQRQLEQRPEHERPARQDPAHRPARRRSATPSRRASRSPPASPPRSTPTASATPGASRSTASRATCSSPTSATPAGRRSTCCRPASPPGANFGWACWEGSHPHGSANCVAARGHPADLRVRARRHALLDHRRLHRPRPDGADARRALPLRRLLRRRAPARCSCRSARRPTSACSVPRAHIAGFGADSDGHLYITSLDGGVWRVTGTGAADKPPVANFTLSSTTPAVGANVHLDASSSTDPDGPIVSYSWDVDGDGKADGKGITFDVSYPTAGARPITLTVGDAAGARSSRTQAVFVGGKAAAGHRTPRSRRRCRHPPARSSQSSASAGCSCASAATSSATWTVTATMRKTAKLRATRLQTVARAAREADVQGAHGQRHAAPAHPGGPPEGHAHGRDPRAGARAGERQDRPALAARARRRLTAGRAPARAPARQ